MPLHLANLLDPNRALIFLITHIANLRWILANGLVSSNSRKQDPSFVAIGNHDVISRRRARVVPVGPGGTLADYVPFYFTPSSVMLYNIYTGYGVKRQPQEDIVILVSSLNAVEEADRPYLFTDTMALLQGTRFFADRADLKNVDFGILKARDFRRDNDDPAKVDRYLAEALVFDHLPVSALVGIGCYNDAIKTKIESLVGFAGVSARTAVRSGWYF